MKLIFKIIGAICLFIVFDNSYSQINVLNAKTPEGIGVKTKEQMEADNDEPLPYGYVDDRDILWSVTVWEFIDLSEKVNFPLLYPIDRENSANDRESLFDVLIDNIKNGNLTEIYTDSYFKNKTKFDDIKASLSRIDTLPTEAVARKLNSGEPLSSDDIDSSDLEAGDIVQYRIKGIWYFDSRQGELKYRLLGIAPVAPDVNFINNNSNNNTGGRSNLVELFWLWYPQTREILHKAKVFNGSNSAKPLSFDHLLNARMFNAVIYKTDDVQGDREIKDYIPENALFQLLESDRIKENIRNREQDMWTN